MAVGSNWCAEPRTGSGTAAMLALVAPGPGEAPADRLDAGQSEDVGERGRHLELAPGASGPRSTTGRQHASCRGSVDEDLRAAREHGMVDAGVFGASSVPQPEACPRAGACGRRRGPCTSRHGSDAAGLRRAVDERGSRVATRARRRRHRDAGTAARERGRAGAGRHRAHSRLGTARTRRRALLGPVAERRRARGARRGCHRGVARRGPATAPASAGRGRPSSRPLAEAAGARRHGRAGLDVEVATRRARRRHGQGGPRRPRGSCTSARPIRAPGRRLVATHADHPVVRLDLLGARRPAWARAYSCVGSSGDLPVRCRAQIRLASSSSHLAAAGAAAVGPGAPHQRAASGQIDEARSEATSAQPGRPARSDPEGSKPAVSRELAANRGQRG